MIKPCALLSLAATFALTGCLSTQYESPYYEEAPSSGAYTTPQTSTYARPINASYDSAQNTAAAQDCRKQETNREIIGGAVGGTAGAFVGKELIGGTKGAVAGAAIGGIAGYGIGDISKNCSAAATRSNASYQSAPRYSATPARFETANCPVGTTPHSTGTCLLDNPSAGLPSQSTPASSLTPAAPIPTYATQNLVRANAPTAPSGHMRETVSRQYGGANYVVRTGDTVYSLARKLCVPVTAIQRSNGLDASYGIKIGQGLSLPASQC